MMLSRFSGNRRTTLRVVAAIAAAVGACVFSPQLSFAQPYTRGIGVYPGRACDYTGPVVQKINARAASTVNVALHRSATASSAIDYNHTAHLATDGIIDGRVPAVLSASTPAGRLSRREAEWSLDGGPYSNNVLMGEHTFISYEWSGGQSVTARSLRLDARMAYNDEAPVQPESQAGRGFVVSAQTSVDGSEWTTIGEWRGAGLPGTAMAYRLSSDPNKQTSTGYLPARLLEHTISFGATATFNRFRLVLDMPGAAYWEIHDIHFLDETGQEVWALPSQEFASVWVSDGGGRQWLRIDLGGPCVVDKVVPHWVEEPRRWHADVAEDGCSVTVVMDEPGPSGFYALREVEVLGRPTRRLVPQPERGGNGTRYDLSGGRWQIARASEVAATGEELSQTTFDSGLWLWATVPGTVLMSYVNAGAVPDPNYADQIDQISESFFRSNFWYRDVFEWTPAAEGERTYLNFDGINWKANVWLNGHALGRIEGAFHRGRFDVTGLLVKGSNALAVEIVCNDHFGVVKEKDAYTTQFNGGILGADNPTFHATIGWDWITTTRGRNAGIWNEVYVTREGALTLSDPYVQTRVGEKVEVTPSVFVRNNTDHPVLARLCGWIGDIRFECNIQLPALAEQEVTFSPADFPQLADVRLPLWWPNGYGEPVLHEAGYEAHPPAAHPHPLPREGRPNRQWASCNEPPSLGRGWGWASGALHYKAGLRSMTYEGLADSLRIYVNGRRFVPLGGNWGMDEHNLCYRRREYDAAVGFHRDMHCTMIRNWVGLTGDDDFYRACDSLGIMVWQDFWLANPVDGPDPYDERMFLSNAYDYLRRIRSHASLGLFCGRNEGYPPATIDRGLRRYVASLTPGLGYIPSSADDGVTGHGPYCAQPARMYFERQSGKIHTERGMPNVMNYENLARTIAPDSLWPQSTQWGQHDYTLRGAQRASEFNDLVDKGFGTSHSAQEFTRRAQLINYNGYRAMFESTSISRAGLLIWMSHPCWPTMVWQTYDYYFEPTAAYFGTKKACEPLHIQLNALTDEVEVVNAFAGEQRSLTATATAYDLSGRRLWQQRQHLTSPDDSTTPLFAIDAKARQTDCAILRLELRRGKQLVSTNDYFVGRNEGDYSALLSLPMADVAQEVSYDTEGERCTATLTLTNRSRTVAPFLRLNLKGADGEQILPAVYSDNYFNLLPKEKRTITISWLREDGRGIQPDVKIEPINMREQ